MHCEDGRGPHVEVNIAGLEGVPSPSDCSEPGVDRVHSQAHPYAQVLQIPPYPLGEMDNGQLDSVAYR